MQFLPSTWAKYGFDADGRGSANPYDPIDAIFSAARYLHAAGAERSLSGSIFAYNHANWYVNSVLLRATLLKVMPAGLVDGLTGLMEASFPIAGHLGSYSTQTPVRTRIAKQPAVTLAAPAGAPSVMPPAMTPIEPSPVENVGAISASRAISSSASKNDLSRRSRSSAGLVTSVPKSLTASAVAIRRHARTPGTIGHTENSIGGSGVACSTDVNDKRRTAG